MSSTYGRWWAGFPGEEEVFLLNNPIIHEPRPCDLPVNPEGMSPGHKPPPGSFSDEIYFREAKIESSIFLLN